MEEKNGKTKIIYGAVGLVASALIGAVIIQQVLVGVGGEKSDVNRTLLIKIADRQYEQLLMLQNNRLEAAVMAARLEERIKCLKAKERGS